MIRLLGKAREINNIAVSGGIDSMASIHFLRNGKHQPTILHFHHGTKHSEKAHQFVIDYCKSNSIKFKLGFIQGQKPKELSWEEWWRNERYKFFHSFVGNVATCHHLNDVAETWLMGAIHGRTKLIPFRNRNVIRPFLLTPQSVLREWAEKYQLCWSQDHSNFDMRYDRNRIRLMIMPAVEKINPGFLKVIYKKVREAYEQENTPVT